MKRNFEKYYSIVYVNLFIIIPYTSFKTETDIMLNILIIHMALFKSDNDTQITHKKQTFEYYKKIELKTIIQKNIMALLFASFRFDIL